MPGRRAGYPLGAAVTLEQLDLDPHAVHHRLRPTEPASWLPRLDGWLVTSHALALEVMRDPGTFTVDDPRFSTARVIGPSMLSLDGAPHARHRAPFVGPFRPGEVRSRFADAARAEARELLRPIRATGRGELRRGFAGPLAAAIVVRALGLDHGDVAAVLADYDAIVGAVTALSASAEAGAPPSAVVAGHAAYADLRARLQPVIAGGGEGSLLATAAGAGDGALDDDAIASNAAVILFGGIETTEGMIASAALEILTRPSELARVRDDPARLDAALEESLRLEPAAAVVDRYTTRDATLGGAAIARGDLVRVSLAAANRDPSIFEDPDGWAPGARRGHLAFAQGPHVCVGVHLARLEARTALAELVAVPGIELDPDRETPRTRGLVFRKPDAVPVRLRR